MTSEIYLNIGSNSGDRRAFIARAVAALRNVFGEVSVRASSVYESDAWGFVSANRFLNIGVEISLPRAGSWTPGELEALLASLKRIEKSISAMPHRTPDSRYADREIDIDIIAVDDIVYSSPTLTLPHPHMCERGFVLAPMAELAPRWRHPQTGLSCGSILEKL